MEKASINLIKDLKKQKRNDPNLLFLDNPKIIKDAIQAGHKPIIALTIKSDLIDLKDIPTYLADKETIEMLSDVKTPQGICVVLKYNKKEIDKPKNNFLVLDEVQDPGNVGTLIRTALASGFKEIYLINSVKTTNSKMIRSSAGACFNTILYPCSREEFISLAKKWSLFLLKTDMKGKNIFKYSNIREQIGVVIGNEGNGISKEISQICSDCVGIPMQDGIESLNAGVSGAIIMYQINKELLGG